MLSFYHFSIWVYNAVFLSFFYLSLYCCLFIIFLFEFVMLSFYHFSIWVCNAVFLSFFYLSLYCLFFDLRPLITLLVSPNLSLLCISIITISKTPMQSKKFRNKIRRLLWLDGGMSVLFWWNFLKSKHSKIITDL